MKDYSFKNFMPSDIDAMFLSMGQYEVSEETDPNFIEHLCDDLESFATAKQEILQKVPQYGVSRYSEKLKSHITNSKYGIIKPDFRTIDYTSIFTDEGIAVDKFFEEDLKKLSYFDYRIEHILTLLPILVPTYNFSAFGSFTLDPKKHLLNIKNLCSTIKEYSRIHTLPIEPEEKIVRFDAQELNNDKDNCLMLLGIQSVSDYIKATPSDESPENLAFLHEQLDKIDVSESHATIQQKKESIKESLYELQSVQFPQEEQSMSEDIFIQPTRNTGPLVISKDEKKVKAMNDKKLMAINKYQDLQKDIDKYITVRNKLFANKKHKVMVEFKQEVQELIKNLQSSKSEMQIDKYIENASKKFESLQKSIEHHHEHDMFGTKRKSTVESRTIYRFIDAQTIAKTLLAPKSEKQPKFSHFADEHNTLYIQTIISTASEKAKNYVQNKGKNTAKVELMEKYQKKLAKIDTKIEKLKKERSYHQLPLVLKELETVNRYYDSKLSAKHRSNPLRFLPSRASKIFQDVVDTVKQLKQKESENKLTK